MSRHEINKYMSLTEAAEKWNKSRHTVRSRLNTEVYGEQIELFIEKGWLKYFIPEGKENKNWIISVDAMEVWFGKEPKK